MNKTIDRQREIIKVIDTLLDEPNVENKYRGDVVCRVIKFFIEKDLPKKFKVVGPNAFIIGYPTEFDLLIVKK